MRRIFNDSGQPVYETYRKREELPPGYSIKPFFPWGARVWKVHLPRRGGRRRRIVYSEPGMYGALLDIASMHPSSIVAENLFGDEYKNFRR